ncbi:MAG: type 4a pilus biogenesis protein PilO [Pseudobdellovibrionaceae bacterium]
MNKLFEFLAALNMQKTLMLALVVGAGFYYTAYNDGSALNSQLQTVEQSLQAEEANKQKTESVLKEKVRMQETLKSLGQQYEEVSKKLPSLLTALEVTKAIDEYARTSAVSVKLKRTGNVEKKELVEEIPVDVALEGSYVQLAQFIYFISSAERLTRIRNFSIETITEGNASRLKLDGQIVGYKLAEEKKGAAAGSPENPVK